MSNNTGAMSLLDRLGDFAKAGISTLAQAQARQQATTATRKAKGGCSPCAAKAAVVAARARVKAGKI